jgi:hypothetical protein
MAQLPADIEKYPAEQFSQSDPFLENWPGKQSKQEDAFPKLPFKCDVESYAHEKHPRDRFSCQSCCNDLSIGAYIIS